LQYITSYLTTIASVITALTVIAGFISVTTTRGKKAIAVWFNKLNEPLNRATLCILRKNIREMCLECIDKEYMTEEDCENITEASEAYDGLGGNSYTHKLVEKAMTLPVKRGSDT
jgi:hypothetical protein